MVKRMAVVMGVLLVMPFRAFPQERGPRESHSSSPPLAKTEAERKILGVLDEMVKSHQVYLNVPMADGKALWLLAEAADAKTIVEIGTSTGYSGLWFCLALEGTGGHLTTFEIDHGRAQLARKHFQEAGATKLVTIVEGNAHETIAPLKGPIDVAFIDADKEGYVDYLDKLLPLVRPGGLILAHNVDMVPNYVKALTTNADLETIFFMEGAGLAVTLKKR
jgi:predicted O-methyltransferase YrrM